MTKIADEYADIKARLDAIRAERDAQGKPEPEPVKPIDWPTMYGVYQAPDDFMGWTSEEIRTEPRPEDFRRGIRTVE